tara:strand:+ start:103 stop:321 length:219 start_codon:yes stop_codon:yes gene_type:complete
MNELKELKQLFDSFKNIEPFGLEPDFSSLGLEPAEVLGFKNEQEVEIALKSLTVEVTKEQLYIIDTVNIVNI